jgi:hypothetical protein
MMDWQQLTELLLEATGDRVAEQGYPTWVLVLDPQSGDDGHGGGDGHDRHDGGERDDGAFSLALKDDPVGLVGWVATSDCRAVGVIATGRLRAL